MRGAASKKHTGKIRAPQHVLCDNHRRRIHRTVPCLQHRTVRIHRRMFHGYEQYADAVDLSMEKDNNHEHIDR